MKPLKRTPAGVIALLSVMLSMVLIGCDQASMMKKLTPAEDEATARNYVDLLRQQKFDEMEQDLLPSLKGPDAHEALIKMASLFPQQEPLSSKVVGFRSYKDTNSTTNSITFEFQFPDQWLLTNVVFEKRIAGVLLTGIHVNPMSASLEELNKFSFRDKGPIQYLALITATISTLFSLFSFILCLKTKIQKGKWLWAILTVVGVAKFTVNWTNGQFGFMPLSVQLPTVTAGAQPYGPWILSIALPLGAIIFLIYRKRISATTNTEDAGTLQQI